MKTCIAAILLFGLVLLTTVAAPAQGGPQAQLKATVDAVIDILQDRDLEVDARRAQLSRLMRARFDFPTMSQWVLGPHWPHAGPAEQQRFIVLFTELLEATYLGRIDEYRDEQVEFLGERIDDRRAQVDSRIVSRSVDIPISYRLVQRGEQWLVFDVIIENVSLVRSYRNSYAEIVRREGMQGLFAQMEQRIAELKDGRGEGS